MAVEDVTIPKKYVWVSSTQPSGVSEGTLWYDTTDEVLYSYDGSIFNAVTTSLTDVELLIARNGLDILDIYAKSSLTAGVNASFVRDIYYDSNGYSNTLDTSNTTATFKSSAKKYMHGIVGTHRYTFEEGTGTTAADTGTGTASDITVVQAEFSASKKFGNYGYEANLNNGKSAGFSSNSINSSGYSVSFWAKRSGNITGALIAIDNLAFGSNGIWALDCASTTALQVRARDNTSTKTSDSITISSSVFDHVVVTLSSSAIKCYLNGTLLGSGTALSSFTLTNATNLTLFADSAGNNDLDNLIIDHLQFHTGVLTQAQVTALYGEGAGATTYQVQTNAQTLSATPSKAMIISHNTTSGSATVTYDLSTDNGAHYQTGLTEGAEIDLTNAGTSLILKQKLTASVGETCEATDFGVMVWP